MNLVKVSIEPKKLAKYTLGRACLRDFNLRWEAGAQIPLDAFMKNMRTCSLPQNQHPMAFPFKDEGGLAEHPLICHHQGVFGYQENA